MTGKKSGEPSWRYRRIVIYAVCAYACWQLYLLIDAQDTRLNETIAWGWQVLVMVLVLGYTGFATVQDVMAIWRMRSAQPYRDEANPGSPVDTSLQDRRSGEQWP